MGNDFNRFSALSDTMQEKRNQHRQRVLKSGIIYFNKGYSSYACKIKNLHESGAMLECENTIGIPGAFQFKTVGESNIVDAKLIWRTDKRLGVTLF